MGIVKAILEYFKNAKKRKDEGKATELDNLILSEADKTTKKLFNATEGTEAEVMEDVINSGTADQTTTTSSGSGSGSGMDMKSMLPIIVIVLAALFFLKR